MEKLCKNCTFWEQRLPSEWEWGGHIRVNYTGRCHSEKFIPAGEHHYMSENDQFIMFDDMGLNVDFYPCAYFGCIHFKARP